MVPVTVMQGAGGCRERSGVLGDVGTLSLVADPSRPDLSRQPPAPCITVTGTIEGYAINSYLVSATLKPGRLLVTLATPAADHSLSLEIRLLISQGQFRRVRRRLKEVWKG